MKSCRITVWVNLNNLHRRICHLSIGFNESRKSFDYIRQTIPDLYFRNSKKQRLFSYLFWHCPLLYNLIRYYYVWIIERGHLPNFLQKKGQPSFSRHRIDNIFNNNEVIWDIPRKMLTNLKQIIHNMIPKIIHYCWLSGDAFLL